MRVNFKGHPVSVVGQTLNQFIIQLPNEGLLMVLMEQCELEVESILDWVKSAQWEKGMSLEEYRKRAA